MCICCEIFPACIDRYWEFPEHPCVVNACCYACCGNGLEDPNLAQRIFCQCNTVANYDECGSEPHLISLALCPFLIPGAVYAAFFWEPHDAVRKSTRELGYASMAWGARNLISTQALRCRAGQGPEGLPQAPRGAQTSRQTSRDRQEEK